jgi:FkbM family methyltransferase
MHKTLQASLLGCYRAFRATGMLSTRSGRALFEFAYDAYKRFLEAGSIEALRPLVRPGTTVIDVGANIGFFTERLSRWVSEGGRVVAIEPEAVNFARLQHRITRRGIEKVVDAIQAVAAETPGERLLEINPHHPGDHRIGETGVPVAALTIDGFLSERGWPETSLIKIDVQGAEFRVLEGAAETIRRFCPALFVEIDDAALTQMGSGAENLITALAEQGYRVHRLTRRGISPPLAVERALALAREEGYADFLFLAVDAPEDRGTRATSTR